MKTIILPEIPHGEGPMYFYLRDENGKKVEAVDYEVYVENAENDEELRRLFQQFEKETGMLLGKTKLFQKEYPEILEDVEKQFDFHYTYDDELYAFVQYNQVRLLAHKKFSLLIVRDDSEESAIWIKSDIESEKEAKELLIQTMKKYKIRQRRISKRIRRCSKRV